MIEYNDSIIGIEIGEIKKIKYDCSLSYSHKGLREKLKEIIKKTCHSSLVSYLCSAWREKRKENIKG